MNGRPGIKRQAITVAAVVCVMATASFTAQAQNGARKKKPPAAKAAPTLQLWVPAYYYPFGDGLKQWERLLATAKQAPIVAIVNPDSGPGRMPDTNFVAIIDRARKEGVTLVGYVGTRYTKRPLAEVTAEVDRWIQFYPKIQGIHVDEQTSDAQNVAYYAELYAYVQKKIPQAVVLSNPGTDCAPEYLSAPAADVVCLFERDQGFESFKPPNWASRFARSNLAVQAYQVETKEKMALYARAAVQHRVGFIYITDARGANPYDRLPSYWEDEVSVVRQLNRQAPQR